MRGGQTLRQVRESSSKILRIRNHLRDLLIDTLKLCLIICTLTVAFQAFGNLAQFSTFEVGASVENTPHLSMRSLTFLNCKSILYGTIKTKMVHIVIGAAHRAPQ